MSTELTTDEPQLQATGDALVRDVEYESEPTIAGLLAMAVQKNLDIDKLERLMALEQTYHQREAERQFNQAKAKFQKDCPPIEKNSTATTGKFKWKYADLGDIVTVVAPLLGKHKLSYTWQITTESEPPAVVVSCTLKHEMGHSETAEFRSVVGGLEHMNQMQQSAAALTYGRRQSLIAVTGIGTADEDVDAQPVPPPRRKGITHKMLDQLKADWYGPRREHMANQTTKDRELAFIRWFSTTTNNPQDQYPRYAEDWTREQYDKCQKKLAEESHENIQNKNDDH